MTPFDGEDAMGVGVSGAAAARGRSPKGSTLYVLLRLFRLKFQSTTVVTTLENHIGIACFLHCLSTAASLAPKRIERWMPDPTGAAPDPTGADSGPLAMQAPESSDHSTIQRDVPRARSTPKSKGQGPQGAYNSRSKSASKSGYGQSGPNQRPGARAGSPAKRGGPGSSGYGGPPGRLPSGGGLPPASQAQVVSQRGGRFGGTHQQEQEGISPDEGAPAGTDEGKGLSTAAFGWGNQGARPAPGAAASNRSNTGSVSSMGSSYRSAYARDAKSGGRPGEMHRNGENGRGGSNADRGGVGDRSPGPTRRPNSTVSPPPAQRRRRPGQVDPGEVAASPGAADAATPERPPPGTKTEGTVRFADGSLYTGELMDNLQHGKGTYRSAVGTYFEGHWAFGKRNGQGTEKYPIGNVYEGNWLEDQKHGYGVVSAQPARPESAQTLEHTPPRALAARTHARASLGGAGVGGGVPPSLGASDEDVMYSRLRLLVFFFSCSVQVRQRRRVRGRLRARPQGGSRHVQVDRGCCV